MPASIPKRWTDSSNEPIVEVRIPVEEGSPEAYMVGEKYELRIELENLTNETLDTSEINLYWGLESDEKFLDVISGNIEIPDKIDAQDTVGGSFTFYPPQQMSFEIVTRRLMARRKDDEYKLSKSGGAKRSIYTSTAWDPDFYEVNYQVPRKIERYSWYAVSVVAGLAVLQAILIGIQLWMLL